ncbi:MULTISPECIES: SDR family NAD(P)-dependent oxidoreductase [unclassified Sphingobium]|uniref:SDR family NAD(P)-dependent oxidoreductase n=1 Tax=unclassified Sphingobium TaxID=2611147 RepID=UPI00119C01B2|nr:MULTISPECIES: SDR family oxidoreductase [unclassified Sphingobium]MBG6120041.1 3-oxoacyl-[acyl-carrier protein] reductase [Sphingobium sp. JAI105]TWD05758.1 NAD(P)-dependent dehydrogenase (short-subunit alcohol dehydrogenase family) [Sphingobium sp. AEW010]TWD23311.1 NAD(P)-dependent dehydrogenase (short-subunit alcohol dehydrogenase family) [Sphingobium sp. AEW013]TWD25171.1 NAD(P)-dependent dehydrogenase (short-subunit alcohol dehydrogenase family) [Sphingobium sp. AEW001]
MGILEGKVAIVADVNDLSLGIATKFAAEGAQVVLVGSGAPAQGQTGRFVAADLDDAAAVTALVNDIAETEGGIDILVNATQPPPVWSPFAEKAEEDFRSAFDAVVMRAVYMMKAAYPHLKARGQGRVINLGSMYGIASHRDVTDAATIDGALIALTRGVGLEWGRDQINVNYLQTAAPDIPAFQQFRKDKGTGVDDLIDMLPMGRMADPVEDVGGAALFLASDEACFIVGHKVLADGGQHVAAPVFEPGGIF